MKSGKSKKEALPTRRRASSSNTLKPCEVLDVDIKTVTGWVIDGNSMFDIGEAMEKHWPGNLIYHKALMEKVKEYFVNSSEADGNVIRGWCLESLRDLYRKMVEIGDFSNAAKVIKDIAKMSNK
ncbi:MAG: hypothetical protein GY839_05320 [candidate division Zixibacteria bacterium]|nr:hypothetical protein [candidate division Zixibacteria bacterium]